MRRVFLLSFSVSYVIQIIELFNELLATLTQEGAQLPNDYFTEFELRRQQFTYFGKLK